MLSLFDASGAARRCSIHQVWSVRHMQLCWHGQTYTQRGEARPTMQVAIHVEVRAHLFEFMCATVEQFLVVAAVLGWHMATLGICSHVRHLHECMLSWSYGCDQCIAGFLISRRSIVWVPIMQAAICVSVFGH